MARKNTARARVDLPPIDQFGPWPKRAGRFAAHCNRHPLEPLFAGDAAALPYYFRIAQQAYATAEAERQRRLELETELAVSNQAFLTRSPPEQIIVERNVFKPMPPREVVRRITIERCSPLEPSIIVTPESEPAPAKQRWFHRLSRWLGD